jgi:hypothetical protein
MLEILALRVRFPHLTHINQCKTDPDAEISKAACEARRRG